jgi:hypothetical protein
MNVEIGTEAAQFPRKEYIKGIFVAVNMCFMINVCPFPLNYRCVLWMDHPLKKLSYDNCSSIFTDLWLGKVAISILIYDPPPPPPPPPTHPLWRFQLN